MAYFIGPKAISNEKKKWYWEISVLKIVLKKSSENSVPLKKNKLNALKTGF